MRRQRARLVRVFFANFLRLLMFAVSVAQCVLLWWFRPAAGSQVFVWGVPGMYAVNRALLTWTQRRRRSGKPVGLLPRLYYAGALTTLFCVAYLGVLGTCWIAGRLLLGAFVVEAGTAHAALLYDRGLDPTFEWLANSGMALVTLAFVYGYTVGQRRLQITRLHLALRRLSHRLDGLRVVQISDIHIGENLSQKQLEGFVQRVNRLAPDLVCITGDIIDSPMADMEALLPTLAGLRATHGVFAILGNHDHYAGADEVEAALRRFTPFTVLRDASCVLPLRGQRLHIVGLDDRGRDWARGVHAVAQLSHLLAELPADEPVLLLCHRPDIFTQAALAGVDLTLSGHTHGGQLGVPWFGGRVRNLAEFITPFDRGLFERNGCYLYVNRGLGVTGQRIRLCAPREITILEIRSPDGYAAAA